MASGGSTVRNMAIFLTLVYGMKNVNQEDPTVINYCRIVFAVYVAVTMALQAYISKKITQKNDQTEIEVTPQASMFAPADAAAPQKKTVMEYDSEQVGQQRSQVLMNGLLIAFLHFKMEQVSPMVLTSVMGLLRFIDDPMFKIHVMGEEATGALQRPFKAEQNPLVNWLMGQMNPQQAEPAVTEGADDDDDDDDGDDDGDETTTTTSTTTTTTTAAAAVTATSTDTEPKKTK